MYAGNDDNNNNNQSTIQQDPSWIEPHEHVPNGYPASLRVLIVDHSPTYLAMLEDMANCYFNQVTTCPKAEDALSILRGNQNQFDIMICELHMPGMDGLKLLETISLEMDLPVVIISEDESKDAVMKSLLSGACDYLLKPVRKETIGIIWQHVVRKKRNEKSNNSLDNNSLDWQLILRDDSSYESASGNEGDRDGESSEKGTKRSQGEDKEGCNEAKNGKKPRVVWTDELHEIFLGVVNELGLEKAVPKKILECMERKNIKGLTRSNIASHLQKYRLNVPDLHAKVRRKTADPVVSLPRSITQGSTSLSQGHGVQAGTSNALHPLYVEPINRIVPDSPSYGVQAGTSNAFPPLYAEPINRAVQDSPSCYPANNRHWNQNILMSNDPFQYTLRNVGPSSVSSRLGGESGVPSNYEEDYYTFLLDQLLK